MHDTAVQLASGAAAGGVAGVAAAAGVDAANDGAVKVAKTSGCAATDSGTVFPPVTPARMRWNMSAVYSREQEGHSAIAKVQDSAVAVGIVVGGEAGRGRARALKGPRDLTTT